METKEYLEYFKYYFQNLAQCRKEKIKSYLLENNICPVLLGVVIVFILQHNKYFLFFDNI